VPAPGATLLDRLDEAGGTVVGVGKVPDIFAGRGITRAVKASGLESLMRATTGSLDGAADRTLVFTNLVDFDQEYGHRRDVAGYARLNGWTASSARSWPHWRRRPSSSPRTDSDPPGRLEPHPRVRAGAGLRSGDCCQPDRVSQVLRRHRAVAAWFGPRRWEARRSDAHHIRRTERADRHINATGALRSRPAAEDPRRAQHVAATLLDGASGDGRRNMLGFTAAGRASTSVMGTAWASRHDDLAMNSCATTA
jgi:hypothetical protein